MTDKDFKNLLNKNSDATYNPQEAAEILKGFNQAISGLYFLGGDERYISETLNLSAYEDEEYKRFIDSIGISLCEVADKLEMVRNILFGSCFNWDQIRIQLEEMDTNSEKS